MRRGLIGLSTPIGYDYVNPIRPWSEEAADIPNPVLENVAGLLVSYDELWFISRELCPIDMQDLPYVHFVSEDPLLARRAEIAAQQFWNLDVSEIDIPVRDSDAYRETYDAFKKAANFELGMDNHSRSIKIAQAMGNAGDTQLFVIDVGMARSLDLEIDLVVNSSLVGSAAALSDLGMTRAAYSTETIAAVEHVVQIHTTDLLSPRGSYHASLEELRSHARVVEFRDFISRAEEDTTRDAVALAKEVDKLAEDHITRALERYVRGRGRIATVGSMIAGVGGNLIHPGLGSAAQQGINFAERRQEKPYRRGAAWSLFVRDAKLRSRN